MGYDFIFLASLAWMFDLFSWEKLASVVTVFSLAIGGALPLWNMARKRRKEAIEAKKQAEIERVTEIAKQATAPIEHKLDEQVKKQDELTTKIQSTEKDTKAILSTVRTLVKEFHSYKGQQEKINTKIYFMDGYIRNVDNNATSAKTGIGNRSPPYPRYRSISRDEDEQEEYHEYDIDMYGNDDNNNHADK